MTFSSTLSRSLLALALISASSWAIAQKAPVPTRARGTIESVAGDVYMVKNRDGAEYKVVVTDPGLYVAIVKATMAQSRTVTTE